jgi:hypothetical protein
MEKINRVDLPLFVLLMFFVLIYSLVVFEVGKESGLALMDNLLSVLLPIGASIFGFVVAKKIGFKSHQGKAVFFLSLSMCFWGVGNIIWWFLSQAVVSIADVFYFAYYFLFILAIMFGLRMAAPDVFNIKKFLLLILVGFGLMILYLCIVPFSWNQEVSFIENFVTNGYVLIDAFALVPLLLLCYSIFSGALSFGWWMVLASHIPNFLGNLYYALNYEGYAAGAYASLLWHMGNLFFIYALVLFYRTHKQNKSDFESIIMAAKSKNKTKEN